MRFRDYLRWEGLLAVAVGASLYAYGVTAGHQGAADAAFSGALMLLGTALFMRLRRHVPMRTPGAWFTRDPLRDADPERPPGPPRLVFAGALIQTVALTSFVVGASYLTGFWLTYVDFGVWAVAVGVIKAGPAASAVALREASTGATLLIARRPWRGTLELSASRIDRQPPAPVAPESGSGFQPAQLG